MSQTAAINTKLIKSLTQIILSLTEEERSLLGLQVGHPGLTETELQAKYISLKQDIEMAAVQLTRGEYTEYTDESLPSLLEDIKQRGRQRLNHQ
jgi:sugar diacid utilization regulator